MLRGTAELIFDLVAQGATPRQWSEWLRPPLERAAASGDEVMVARLTAAGGAIGNSLHQAVRGGHLQLVDRLLSKGASTNATDERGAAPTHIAAALGHEEIMASLLRNGADRNAVDGKGRTPLHLAIEYGRCPVARTLLASDADACLRFGENALSAMDLVVRYDRLALLKAMLKNGAHVDATSPSTGCTALHCAAATTNRVGAIAILVDAGASVDTEDSNCWTPLHYASDKGRSGAVGALLKYGADKNRRNSEGRTPLHLAVAKGHLATALNLLSAGADISTIYGDTGHSALDSAARFGHVDVLEAMVQYGADVNAPSPIGAYVPLHQAAFANHATAIDVLVKGGASVGAESNKGATPLHTASAYGSFEAARALLKHGADPNSQNAEGQTPLHCAASRAGGEGAAKCVELLVGRGADGNVVDKYGQTAADLVGMVGADEDLGEGYAERIRTLLAGTTASSAGWEGGGIAGTEEGITS